MRRGRGGMQRGGYKGAESRGVALMRANLMEHQSNSMRRLLKDLKELQTSDTPLVGVSALPLDDSMYTWTGNLKGPAKTIYAGGVWHFEMNFPQDYPVSPPKITLFTDLPHPNVFGRTICLDMLQPGKHKEWYQGWTSAYTVESILVQLQSFLFYGTYANIVLEEVFDDNASVASGGQSQINSNELQLRKELAVYKKAIEEANAFKCEKDKHRGALEPYPPFNKREQDTDAFCFMRDEKDLLKDELLCYHTRLQLNEVTLGVGITTKVLPRTGKINSAEAQQDLLSMRAFNKQKVRHSISGERFTSWLPLYFGEKGVLTKKKQVWDEKEEKYYEKEEKIDLRERNLTLLKKTISYLTQGSTRKPFNADSVMELMPKLLISYTVGLVEQRTTLSIEAIRRFVNFMRLFRLLIELMPETEAMIAKKVSDFISDESLRHKDHCSSLGDLVCFSTISQAHTMADVLKQLLDEQLDRQVFWILKEMPELDHTDPLYKGKQLNIVEEKRNEVCFKSGVVGFRLTMAWYAIHKELDKLFKADMNAFSQTVDENWGCLPRETEWRIFNNFKNIFRVENFKQYYEYLDLQCLDDQAMQARLRKAVENSKAKKYHGGTEHMNAIPTMQEQSVEHLMREPSPFVKYDEAKSKYDTATPAFWQKCVEDRFDWVAHIQRKRSMHPAEIAQASDDRLLKEHDSKAYDHLQVAIKDMHYPASTQVTTVKNTTIKSDYSQETFTWQQLFLKLCFEEMLNYFEHLADFKIMYKYINAMSDHITSLCFRLLDKTNLKSNSYYLMLVTGKMKALKTLKIKQSTSIANSGQDSFKFLLKGFTYMQKNGQSLEKIETCRAHGCYSDDYMYQILKTQPNLQVLKFNQGVLSKANCVAIGKILADFKQIKELDLTATQLAPDCVKEIADGLMRAKQLEIIKMGQNPGMGKAANAVIYNLAFSPKIRHIDLEGLSQTDDDTAEALYKLLKISGAIETLILKGSSVIHQLKEEFCKALGENKTIKYLDLTMKDVNLNIFAKGIAMNARRNGCLETVVIDGWMNSYSKLQQFLEQMMISDKDHEEWYGDRKTANEMTKHELVKKFHCNLKCLSMKGFSLNDCRFDMKARMKEVDPVWPRLMNLFSMGQLDINMSNCRMTHQKTIELISACIGDNKVGQSTVRSLNLSKNTLQIEGAKIFAPSLNLTKCLVNLDLSSCSLGATGLKHISEALAVNSSIKNLNLYRNILDADGARHLGKALAKNNTIEFLDVGHNRIRQTGLKAICEGIMSNGNSKVKKLSIRSNFINFDGFTYFFAKMVFDCPPARRLQEIYLKNNFLMEYQSLIVAKQIEDKQIKGVFIDAFEHIDYMFKQRLEKGMWVAPTMTLNDMKDHIESTLIQKECGLITDIRIRKGRKVPGRKAENQFAIVEFAHPNSIARGVKCAYMRDCRFGQQNVKSRFVRTGTRTCVFLPSQKRR